ncbi:endonuclease III [Candidatus Dojkabacteria bacterium]|nr:endonuclease III [Candidatus Dojkabacteria bacterium]
MTAKYITALQRVDEIIQVLSQKYPNPQIPLIHSNIFELLVAVLLSAQMQDLRLNKVLPTLFKRYPDAKSLASADRDELENIIRSVNYYKTKSSHLIATGKILFEKHKGKVPSTMNELLTLPGIGRKSANVILNEGFYKPVGIVVDTHVIRVSNRLDLSNAHSAEKVEKDLVKIVPKMYWREFSLWLIFHGRNTCFARKPLCKKCEFKDWCPAAI